MVTIKAQVHLAPRFFAFVVALALTGAASAQGTAPPTDTDLRAAYCMAITKGQLGVLSSIFPDVATPGATDVPDMVRKSWSEENDKLQHLRSYLVPRLQYIDALSVLAAEKRGEHDVARVNNDQDLQACTARCPVPASTNDLDAYTACTRSCEPEMLTRIWACNDLSWLPF
ncbi:MAG TPA: hypothetical protein VG105_15975 [Paraburkholderia sp.]|jgi:hypothetical protein|nr:hypothetical protein [Paraburkholderia sp.]